ncbi:MAG: hypothetical protein EBV86_03930 [Marivivens sp.]|nr:hypothetical protein [Marivivens sp.]
MVTVAVEVDLAAIVHQVTQAAVAAVLEDMGGLVAEAAITTKVTMLHCQVPMAAVAAECNQIAWKTTVTIAAHLGCQVLFVFFSRLGIRLLPLTGLPKAQLRMATVS